MRDGQAMDRFNRRDITVAAVIWLIVTGLAVAGALVWDPFPTSGAEEADFIDDAFETLTYLAAPVFGFVIAVLAYSVLRFRARGEPAEDGPPMHGRGMVPVVWVLATAGLAAVVAINPGLTGLVELRSNQTADLEIDVDAFRWAWSITYVESGVRVISPADELVLPAGRRVQFNVRAIEADILHSFWVPAFRVKADAVPGQTETVFVTLTETGTPDDVAYRLQCAELCGLGHARMSMGVRVLEPGDFDAWLSERAASAARVR